MNVPNDPDRITNLFTQEFQKAFHGVGLDAVFIAKSLKSLVKAKKTDTFKGKFEKFEEGKIVSVTEEVIYSRPMADNGTRLKAIELTLRVYGINLSGNISGTIKHEAGENITALVAMLLSESNEPIDD